MGKTKKKPTAKKKTGRKVGRPFTGGGDPQRKYRCSEADFAVIRAAAEAAGVSVSEWTRGVLLREAGK